MATDDKISQLPEPILHHILSLLSQNDAVRTCVLSKSWRYLWCARPVIDFRECSGGLLSRPLPCYCETCFRGNKQTFLSVLDKTLQRYHDHNLSVHELRLEMSRDNDDSDSQSNSLLKKWIPKFVTEPGLKAFHLSLRGYRGSEYFDLPSVLFKAESLEILYLKGCKLLSQIDYVLLNRLQTLTLHDVHVSKETLETMLSSSCCPLLENVYLYGCRGFKTIKVCSSKPHGRLKVFVINDVNDSWQRRQPIKDPVGIEIDIPTIERIRVIDCWFHHHSYLPHLTSLFMNQSRLSSESIGFLSGKYLPCLEHLTLESCYLPEEFNLRLSGTVKGLCFRNVMTCLKASIDAPNIVRFMYESTISHSAISFTTTSSEWKSNIIVDAYTDLDNDASLWLNKLSELLKEFSQSEISLELNQRRRNGKQLQLRIKDDDPSGLFGPVLEVERFSIRGDYSYPSLWAYLKCLFRIFRPRYIEQHLYFDNDENVEFKKRTKLAEFLMAKFLIMRKDMRQYSWPRGLEEVTMVEAFDEHAKRLGGMKACFQLEWGELSYLI